MTLRPGRPRKGALVDLGIYPNDDDCYQPAPRAGCESLPFRMDLDDGQRLDFTRYYRRGTSILNYFGINQSVLVGEDDWRDVARIDCSHGKVHRHRFTHTGLKQGGRPRADHITP